MRFGKSCRDFGEWALKNYCTIR